MVCRNTIFISSVEHVDVYYIKECPFKQNKIPIFINVAVGCKAIIFTCEVTVNNSHVRLSVLSVPEIPIKHYTLCNVHI